MNIQHIPTSQRGIAYLLLISQLLTSCGWNETILPSKKQERTIQQGEYDFNTRASDSTFQVDITADIPSKLALPDKPQETASERLSQPKQGIPLIVNTPDQLLDLRKTDSKQPPAKEKKEPSLGHTRLKPVKQKTRNLSKQNFPLKTSEQQAIKQNQVKNLSFVNPRSQEPTDPTLVHSTIKPALSYGPYPIQRGYQVKFIKQAGKWVAQVKESLPIGISREPMMLPVYLEFGLSMEEVSSHPHLDMVLPTKSNDGQGYVVCTRQAGLPGGVKEGDKCIYREDQKVYDEGLGRWVCPGDGKHPRSGPTSNNNAPASSKDIGLMLKEGFQGLSQLGSFGGILDHLARSTPSDEWRKKQEEEYQQQRERDRIEKRAWEAQKKTERQCGEELRSVYSDIDSIKKDLCTKYQMNSNNTITLADWKKAEAFQQDIIKAINAIAEKEKELGKIAEKYEGSHRFLYHDYGMYKEELTLEGPFEPWQLTNSKSMELYQLYVKADRLKDWFIFYEKTMDELQKQADEIYKLSKKVSTDEMGLQVLDQVVNKAKVLQEYIDNAIGAIEWYGGRPAVKPSTSEPEFMYMPLASFREESPKSKKIPRYQPSNDYKERMATSLRNSKADLETIIKNYTRRKDIAYPHMKKVGEYLVNQGIKVIQEQGTSLFPYQVENYSVELRPKKGQDEITEKMMKEILPDDQTVCIEKYLELMEVVVIGIGKDKGVRKVTTIKLDIKMPSKEPIKMTDIEVGNYANLIQSFNKALTPVTSKLNQLIKEGKDPVATLEQAKKVEQSLQEATEQLERYATTQDKKPNLEYFSNLQATIEARIQLEQHKVFLHTLPQEVDREGAKTNELIKQHASPTTIIQEANRFKGKIEEMREQVKNFDYERHQVVHSQAKVLQDLTTILQKIDGIIKEQNKNIFKKELDEIKEPFDKELKEIDKKIEKIQEEIREERDKEFKKRMQERKKEFKKEMEEWDKDFDKKMEEWDKKSKKRMEEWEQESKKRMEEFGKELARIVEEGSKKQNEKERKENPEAMDSLDSILDQALRNLEIEEDPEIKNVTEEELEKELELSEDEETLLADISTDLQQTSHSLPKVEEISNNNSAKETTNQKEEEWQDKKEKNKEVRQEDQGTILPSLGNFFVGSSVMALDSITLQGKNIKLPGPYIVLSEEGKEQQAALTTTASKTEVEQNKKEKEEKTVPPFGPKEISAAAVKAVEDVKNHKYFKNGEAACNVGLNFLFQTLTGSTELIDKNSKEVPPLPICANDMMEHFANSANWEEIELADAHELANQGYLVVAGWHSLSQTKSGHVAVVVPGKMEYSKEWDCKVPMTMDTGENKRWALKMLSYSFGKEKKETVKFFRYKGL